MSRLARSASSASGALRRSSRPALLTVVLLLTAAAAVQTISAGRADFAALGATTVSDAGASVTLDASALLNIAASSVETVELTATRLDAAEAPALPDGGRYEVLTEAVYRLSLGAYLAGDLQPASLDALAQDATVCLPRPQTAWNPVLMQHAEGSWRALQPTEPPVAAEASYQVCGLSREIGVVAVANAERLRTHLHRKGGGSLATWTAPYTVRASELLAELPGVDTLFLSLGARWLVWGEPQAASGITLDFSVFQGDVLWLEGALEDTVLPAPGNLRAAPIASGMLFLSWIDDPFADGYTLSWTSTEGDEGSIEVEAGAEAGRFVGGLTNDRDYMFTLHAQSGTDGFADSAPATIVATPQNVLGALFAIHNTPLEQQCTDRGVGYIWDDNRERCVYHFIPDHNVEINIGGDCVDDNYENDAGCYEEWLRITQELNEACRNDPNCIYPEVDTRGRGQTGAPKRGAVGDSSEYGNGGTFSPDPVDPVYKAAVQTAYKNANICTAAGGSVDDVNACIARGGRPATQMPTRNPNINKGFSDPTDATPGLGLPEDGNERKRILCRGVDPNIDPSCRGFTE